MSSKGSPGDASAANDRTEATSDGSLLRRFQRGEANASTALYLRYAQRLRALAEAQSSPELKRRVEPEEIVQSVFRTFFRRASKGDYAVPEGEEIWKLLLVIALNKVRTAGAFHRAAKRDLRQTASGPAYERAVQAETGDDEAALIVLKLVIDELLEGLPAANRQMIELRIEGYEVAEIAQKVQRSKRSVERVLQDFRTRLNAQLHVGP